MPVPFTMSLTLNHLIVAVTMDVITIDAFPARTNETFKVTGPGTPLDLVLIEVEDLGEGFNKRAFSLMFAGPFRPILPQATYRLENPATGPLDIFLVPLGAENGLFRYQAVFT